MHYLPVSSSRLWAVWATQEARMAGLLRVVQGAVGRSRSELSKLPVGRLWAGTPEGSAKRPVHNLSMGSGSPVTVHSRPRRAPPPRL